jgi:hypothetical protein
MDQHARMFKVMALLVAAMTVTTALLIWIEPSRTSAQVLVPALAAEQAQRVVATDRLIPTGRWFEINVGICADRRARRSNVLAAIAPNEQFHFVVMPNGHVQATAAWHHQESIGELYDVVQIGVGCHQADGFLSASQRTALEALLLELSHRCAPPNGWRTVSFHNAIDGNWLAGILNDVLPDLRA